MALSEDLFCFLHVWLAVFICDGYRSNDVGYKMRPHLAVHICCKFWQLGWRKLHGNAASQGCLHFRDMLFPLGKDVWCKEAQMKRPPAETRHAEQMMQVFQPCLERHGRSRPPPSGGRGSLVALLQRLASRIADVSFNVACCVRVLPCPLELQGSEFGRKARDDACHFPWPLTLHGRPLCATLA